MDCPFVYANGRQCRGRVTRIEAYRCDVIWDPDTGKITVTDMRSHLHLLCSLKGDHTGFARMTDNRIKMWPRDLPEDVQQRLQGL